MKKISIVLSVLVLSCGLMFASSPLEKSMKDFSANLEKSVISASVNQNVYADAYIGKFFPSFPPHFGVGVNASAAQLDLTEIKTAAELLDINALNAMKNDAYLPLVTLDARIGGIFLPFDLGVSVMKLDFKKFVPADYQTVGADIRIPLIKQNLLLPNVSIGAAYYKTKANFAPTDALWVSLDTDIISISAQVSKTILIVTPFIGGRFVTNKSTFSYKAKNTFLNEKASFTKKFMDDYSLQAYAGASIKLLIPVTVAASYDFTTKLFAGTCSLRFQL